MQLNWEHSDMTASEAHFVGLDLQLAESVSISLQGDPLDADLEAELRGGRYVCVRLDLRIRAGHERGITGEDLRQIPVAEYTRWAAENDNQDVAETIRQAGARALDAPDAEGDVLEVVAAAYRYGYALGSTPTHEVMELLGIPRWKASRLIAAAREEKLLDATSERRPGGVRPAVRDGSEDSLRSAIQQTEAWIAELERRLEEQETIAAESSGSLEEFALRNAARLQAEIDSAQERRHRLDKQLEDLIGGLDSSRGEL